MNQIFNLDKIKKIVADEGDSNKKYFIIDKDAPKSGRTQGNIFYQNGQLWTIKGGIQVKYQKPQANYNCKKCNKWCHRKMDVMYFNAQGMCQDCFLKLQTQMRVDGTWDDYITKIQLQHAIGYLKDNITVLQQSKKQVQQNNLSFVGNQSGFIQKWHLPKQTIMTNINNRMKVLTQKLQHFQNWYNQLLQKIGTVGK